MAIPLRVQHAKKKTLKIKIIHVTYSIIIIITLFTIDNKHIKIYVQSTLEGKKGNSSSGYKLQNLKNSVTSILALALALHDVGVIYKACTGKLQGLTV